MNAPRQNKGHGHVYPRADGHRAQCGGVKHCVRCRREEAEAKRMRDFDAA